MYYIKYEFYFNIFNNLLYYILHILAECKEQASVGFGVVFLAAQPFEKCIAGKDNCRMCHSRVIASIVEDKHSDPALAGKLPQGSRYPNGQEQEELLPIEGRVAEETVIGTLGSSMVVML